MSTVSVTTVVDRYLLLADAWSYSGISEGAMTTL